VQRESNFSLRDNFIGFRQGWWSTGGRFCWPGCENDNKKRRMPCLSRKARDRQAATKIKGNVNGTPRATFRPFDPEARDLRVNRAVGRFTNFTGRLRVWR
jgi:hypothetical protein